jgi:stage V sporulation protein G
MEITEVRIKLIELTDDRLQAFCSITFDNSFVVRDLKIIEGPSGPFIAMPSRKIMAHCPRCRFKNHLRSNFCNQCGAELPKSVEPRSVEQRGKLYADIAHPINSECRDAIQRKIVEAFYQELDRSRQPGYRSTYDDIDESAGALRQPSMAPVRAADSLRADEEHDTPPPGARPQPRPSVPQAGNSGQFPTDDG